MIAERMKARLTNRLANALKEHHFEGFPAALSFEAWENPMQAEINKTSGANMERSAIGIMTNMAASNPSSDKSSPVTKLRNKPKIKPNPARMIRTRPQVLKPPFASV
jgi:hypothetical protein